MDRMIDVVFFRTARQDATLTFAQVQQMPALYDSARLPGVLAAEPFRMVGVRISNGPISRRVVLQGQPEGVTELSRVLGTDEAPMTMPEDGIILSEALAQILGVRTGSLVNVTLLDGDQRSFSTPVSGISLGYLGLGAYAGLPALDRMTGTPGRISGVTLALDPALEADFYAAVRATPMTGFLALNRLSVEKFRTTLAENVRIMTTVYTVLGAIIAIGVVYNFARIVLSE